MGEKVVVRQNSDFETEFWALDPEEPESGLYPAEHLNSLTPYGMLLAGLGSCTAIVVNTYAQHHGIELKEVELSTGYARVFAEDCKSCEGVNEYEDRIQMEISFKGDITSEEQQKLFKIALQCPIHKMLRKGAQVKLVHAKPAASK